MTRSRGDPGYLPCPPSGVAPACRVAFLRGGLGDASAQPGDVEGPRLSSRCCGGTEAAPWGRRRLEETPRRLQEEALGHLHGQREADGRSLGLNTARSKATQRDEGPRNGAGAASRKLPARRQGAPQCRGGGRCPAGAGGRVGAAGLLPSQRDRRPPPSRARGGAVRVFSGPTASWRPAGASQSARPLVGGAEGGGFRPAAPQAPVSSVEKAGRGRPSPVRKSIAFT